MFRNTLLKRFSTSHKRGFEYSIYAKATLTAVAAFVSICFFGSLGCDAKSNAAPPDDTPPAPGKMPKPKPGEKEPEQLPTVVKSSKGRLKFKNGRIYARALADGLRLSPEQLCQELGQYDCVEEVHRISLLGVEPYRTGIIERLPHTVVSTPLAVERVALSACTTRARFDLSQVEDPAVFKNIALDNQGGIADPEQMDADIREIYRRLLARNPEDREIVHHKKLYQDIVEMGDPQPAQTWASLSCFAVATSIEALFF